MLLQKNNNNLKLINFLSKSSSNCNLTNFFVDDQKKYFFFDTVSGILRILLRILQTGGAFMRGKPSLAVFGALFSVRLERSAYKNMLVTSNITK